MVLPVQKLWPQVVSYNLEWWKIFGQMKGNGGEVDTGSPNVAQDESIYDQCGPLFQSYMELYNPYK